MKHTWTFPLPRTHTGVLLGNSLLGLMVWGGDRTLHLTVSRADFWDHRGGMPWTGDQSFAAIRRCLQENNETELRRLFERAPSQPGQPERPSILPVGRFDLTLPTRTRLVAAELDLQRGRLCIQTAGAHAGTIQLVLDPKKPLVLLRANPGLPEGSLQAHPAWEFCGDALQKRAIAPPEKIQNEQTTGWIQTCPADPPLCACARQGRRVAAIAVTRGATAKQARQRANRFITPVTSARFINVRRAADAWWQQYHQKAATVRLPNASLQFLHDYGQYKFGAMSAPHGIPVTLQGPWFEDDQLPPWSGNYHFNINVQMCYWPAYQGNLLEHLRPLFAMIQSWLPVLRHNAEVFAGIRDGVMLPHAVDDRATCMGGFWTGSVDHACTAWVAQMMYRYYRYSGDKIFLRNTAFPFMRAAMRVYEQMLDQHGKNYSLPVSVSPEYRGAAMNAWGRNASFQLACIHRLLEDLLAACNELKQPPNPVWLAIQKGLPRTCRIGRKGHERIALWEKTPLEESHRHHSHLAGITPFDTLNLADPAERGIVERSLREWIEHGPGKWSGWCVPWAAMIHARVGNAEAAELWLEIWQRLFTNEGHGTLHDVAFPGFSLLGRGPSAFSRSERKKEIMQIEAGMSCVAAIYEMLLHERRGIYYLFPGCPRHWQEVSFRGMRTAGAYLLDAERRRGKTIRVRVHSLAGLTLRLANPWPATKIKSGGRTPKPLTEAILTLRIPRGGTIELLPATSRAGK